MSEMNAGDIIVQLKNIFQAQKNYVSSDKAFEDVAPWTRLASDWEQYNSELTNYMLHSKLIDSELAEMNLLAEEHHKLCNVVQMELSKLGRQISEIKYNKRARQHYEYSEDISLFYDKKK